MKRLNRYRFSPPFGKKVAVATPSRHQKSIREVECWLETFSNAGIRSLSESESKSYSSDFILGYRISIAFPDSRRELDLLFNGTFPRTPPRVALVNQPPFATWPHVEKNGLLCVLPPGAEVSPYRPVDVVQNVLGAACELIEDCISGRNNEHFQDEFLSYWIGTLPEGTSKILSLVRPSPPTRTICILRTRGLNLVAEEEDDVIRWLKNRYGEKLEKKPKIERAGLIWLSRPLEPSEYPNRGMDLVNLAEKLAENPEILSRLAKVVPKNIHLILASETRNGPCLAGVSVPKPKVTPMMGIGSRNPILDGYRKCKIPTAVIAQRFFSLNSVARSAVLRVDAPWIHGRGRDKRFERLRNASVVIIGSGSLGSAIGMTLARSGIGKLTFIDPDALSYANLGRHELGAKNIGENKATSMAERVRTDFPEILSSIGYDRRWHEVAAENLEVLTSCHLIVSAVGDWGVEGALNEWNLAQECRMPILYGWTEPHACAGHSVLIAKNGGCLQCGFSDQGVPNFRVTEWPDEAYRIQEPACGGVYQPYGPIELSFIASMISEMAVGELLASSGRSFHRVWIGNSELLNFAGGRYTKTYLDAVSHPQKERFVFERPWNVSDECEESCGKN